MTKLEQEIRDPIHGFIKFDLNERKVLQSRPVQRLRHIHQLALTYLLYPGASHKRFEHSLGVMELASRVFDVITNPKLPRELKNFLPEMDDFERERWRKIIRIAALCHDIGHLPFSHAAEKELLPMGISHENITRDLILSDEMTKIWKDINLTTEPNDIVKLALGPDKAKDLDFNNWETILAEIIVGDAFGVDRMDYLLRDSHHLGVVYGKFDHYRLIDSLRILWPPKSDEGDQSEEPTLGIDAGGIHCAESLLLARYFMFKQVYFHHVRWIYDIHLREFLSLWDKDRKNFSSIDELMKLTDNHICVAIQEIANNKSHEAHDPANRIMNRLHFKRLYDPSPADFDLSPDPANAIYKKACVEFGADNLRIDSKKIENPAPEFPVLDSNFEIVSARQKSDVLEIIPPFSINYVFISPEIRDKARVWLDANRVTILNESITVEEENART